MYSLFNYIDVNYSRVIRDGGVWFTIPISHTSDESENGNIIDTYEYMTFSSKSNGDDVLYYTTEFPYMFGSDISSLLLPKKDTEE